MKTLPFVECVAFLAAVLSSAIPQTSCGQTQDLQPVDPATVTCGNFYSLADVLAGRNIPPLPFYPPGLDLYLWGPGDTAGGGWPLYLFDDRSLVASPLLQSAQMDSASLPPAGCGD